MTEAQDTQAPGAAANSPNPAPAAGAPAPAAGAPARSGRRSLFIILGIAFVALAAWAIYYFAYGRTHVGTDDAYVDGNLVRLTPQVAGTVIAIHTDETQFVQRGAVLVELDPRDTQVALAQAKATLAQTVRDVAQLFAEEQHDQAVVRSQQVQLAQANEDLQRDRPLIAVHGVALETLQHEENAVHTAAAALEQAEATLASTRAAIAGTTPETHPRVLQAEANLRSAWLAAARTKVLAPVSGYVVRRAVQLGQQVSPSTEMLGIVPIDSMWVDANFKENQLSGLRIGQPVDVSADMYGSHVRYHGRVLGLTPGTGSALAVLPAQNAAGNWIKIVQRLPVRIGLDPDELERHPLFLGLSTKVEVDVSDQSGATISRQPSWHATLDTDVYGEQDAGADAAINAIVAANLGHATGDTTQLARRGARGQP
jgi:membrane fusion protein, multidrug efflux system